MYTIYYNLRFCCYFRSRRPTVSTCSITLPLYNLTNSTSAGVNTYFLSPIETKVSGSIDDLLSIVIKMQNASEE